MNTKRWVLKKLEDEGLVDTLSADLNGLPSPLARTLALRGVRSFEAARHFFRASLADLHDPFLLKDMDKAVKRIEEGLQRGDKFLIYGDYDVDGTTSTALLTSYLLSAGGNVAFFIPDRFEHGYGLSRAGMAYAAGEKADLVIALDCGVTAHDEAIYARELGMDLIICDHHTTLDSLPDAIAVLNPKRIDCPYPFEELCGCGLAFKLVQALNTTLGGDPEELFQYLDLVAVATASDVVSVTGENRILLREGLRRLRTRPRVGFRAMAEGIGGNRASTVRLSEATATSIVFTVGPRINAAGRLGDAQRAVSLLMATDEIEAVARARQLERLNEERRALDKEIQVEAFRMADRLVAGGMRHSFVLHHPEWHLGVIGIVASRLVERHMRPVLMLTTVDFLADRPMAKGSARSIEGINVYDALMSCSDLLVEFGGHDQAAGVKLAVEDIPAFAERFEKVIAGMVTPQTLEPVVQIDARLDLAQLDERFWAVLKQFAPFGPDNPTPIFEARGLQVAGPVAVVGKDRSHLKFSVRACNEAAARKAPLDVIGFRMSQHLDTVTESQSTGKGLDMLFCIEENTWNGRTKLQLQARDLRLGSG